MEIKDQAIAANIQITAWRRLAPERNEPRKEKTTVCRSMKKGR